MKQATWLQGDVGGMISIAHYLEGFNMIHEYNIWQDSLNMTQIQREDRKMPSPPLTTRRSTRNTKPTTPPSKNRSPTKSPYFQSPSPSKRPRLKRETSSCLSFPPLQAEAFGLIQEKLHDDPFQLLIAVVFLNRTKGIHAVPVFSDLMKQYPTPKELAEAPLENIVETIRHLGLQNQRAKKLKAIAQVWLDKPPHKDRRYRTLNYPCIGDGKNIKANEILDENDERHGSLEIAHIPGLSRYAWDSWRIFCRDELRGLAGDYKGTGADVANFEPEWKRVLPEDKELRPCLRWMWLKEGWDWNPLTGEKTKATRELLDKANEGRLDWHEPMHNPSPNLFVDGRGLEHAANERIPAAVS